MKLSVQSQNLVNNFGFEQAYRMIREAGFEAIDWNIDHSLRAGDLLKAEKLENLCIFEKSQEEILAHYGEELDAIRANGLVITQAHAPFPAYRIQRPETLDYTIGLYKNIIRFCGTVGCRNLIIHGINRTESRKDMTLAEQAALNRKLYESLIPTLQEVGNVTVCLENLFVTVTEMGGKHFVEGHCSDPHSAAELIDSLNEKAGRRCFGLCLDVGHLNLLRKSVGLYLSVLNDRICALHIHDNDQMDDCHLMPYTGTVHWQDFLTELKAIGYAGDLSFETFAQVKDVRLPKELVPAFLGTIADIGKYFREQLEQ